MNAVIVVDMLNGFLHPSAPLYLGFRAPQVTAAVNRLLQEEKKQGSVIFLACDAHEEDDKEFRLFPKHCVRGSFESKPISALEDFGPVVAKSTYSAFAGTNLAQQLQALSPQKVIVCGVCTDICVLYTVADAVALGFNVEIPTQCVASYNEDAHHAALIHMEKILGAKLTGQTKVYSFDEATLKGKNADIYFLRTAEILRREGIDNQVVMDFFPSSNGILCGIKQALALLKEVLPSNTSVWAQEEGEVIGRKDTILRVMAPYSSIAIYETALLGILSSQTGWATAAKACQEAAGGIPCISFGARHVHPQVSAYMEYAAIIGGCQTCATSAGAKLAGTKASGTMPHALVLNMGDTVKAALAFDKHMGQDIKRNVLVDTFKDETEEALRVATAMGERLHSIRLDTPRERGGVTADLIKEVRARLDQAGHAHVQIFVSGGLTPQRISDYRAQGAPVDGFGIGSFISGASAIDFTADIYQINGVDIAKRGRIPGLQPNPKLKRVI